MEVWSSYDKGVIPCVRYNYYTPSEGFGYTVTENKVTTDPENGEVIKTFIQTDGLGRELIKAKTGCNLIYTQRQMKSGGM